MRIAYVLIGLAVAAAVGYKVHSAAPTVAPTVAMPIATEAASPSPTASITPPPAAAPVDEFTRVPDLAYRRLDVAEYLLDNAGLGHTVVGDKSPDAFNAADWQVCSTLPHAGMRVRTGTRVALVVEQYECTAKMMGPNR